ncbi:MAG: hypothetical protein GEV03_29090, partial [Streptosporangiales bacterium]|nr:hypothetical protein [Streptosporangiales bacterium]
MGKTALALRWAHRVAPGFPERQFYLDLRGHAPDAAMTTGEALARLLRSLGVPSAQIPPHEDEQASLYRSLLADRRVLVVLDNAASPQQVRPLLPGSSRSLVVVTSRSQLSGLVARDGAHRLTLDVLTPTQATELLRRIIGSRRIKNEPDAATELARRCGHLPLALRIAGERVASRRHATVGGLVGELADEENRLSTLATDDDDEYAAVGTVFSWSYRALSPEAARAFRLLGLHAGPDMSAPAAAALVGAPMGETRRLLTALTSAHLLQETGRDRYRFHDLVRLYALERANAEETEESRAEAIRRVLAWYVHTATAAGRAFIPPAVIAQTGAFPVGGPPAGCQPPAFAGHDQALDWCETENANLVAAVYQANRSGEHVAAWQIPIALGNFLFLRKPWTSWVSILQLSRCSAEQISDRAGEARMRLLLGIAYRDIGRPDEAVGYCRQALVVCKNVGFSLRAADAGEDLVGVFGPGEGPWVVVPAVDERADGGG